jgi:hypothetical protein
MTIGILMLKLKAPRRRTKIVVGAVAIVAFGGAAFAYWTSTGTGTGTATTGEAVEFTITSEPGVGDLSPGSAGQTVAFTVTNPAEGTQSLTAVEVSIADAGGAPWVPTGTCVAADYHVTITTPPPAGEIAPGDEVGGIATVTMDNTAANQDDCQGQSVPLYFEADPVV